MASGHFSYDSTIRVEDVKPLIANVSIKSTPYMSSISEGDPATDTEHKWMQDVLEDSGDNAGIEATDPTYGNIADPTKVINITQIMRKPFTISDTKLSIKLHGMSDNWDYHKTKKAIALKKDMEHALLFGTIASGTGSAARRMKGLISFISTYKDGSSYSGVQLSATIFAELAKNVWTNSDLLGGNVLVGAYQKRRISETFANYNSANRRNVVVNGRTLSMPIDTVDSDFGEYNVLLSHEINSVVPGSIVAYRPEYSKVVYLQGWSPQAREYARTGLARKGEVVTQVTQEVYNEKTNGVIENLATS